MTSTICTGAADGATGRLRDTRDKKVYWVTKFKNMCWMTQNLDLDLDSEVNLTSADSDVEHAVTLTSTSKGATGFVNNAGLVQSFDPGYYVYTQVSATTACSNIDLTKCSGWLNILNGIWKASTEASFSKVVDDVTNTYNAHYLVGNYYSYAAATAGTAPSDAGTASSSICPKGWRLPTGSASGATDTDLYKAFNGLTVAQITTSPYYFVYGGNVYNSSPNSAGSTGWYWSSTAGDSNGAYVLYFSTSVNPSYAQNRYRGLSVRCVAR